MEAKRVGTDSVGIALTGEDGRLASVGRTGEAVRAAFVRRCDEFALDDESGLHGPRGASCREPTRKGGISIGGAP
jgi:hypothetical protein